VQTEVRVRSCERHLQAFLGNARGIAGDLPPNIGAQLPPRRALNPRSADMRPRRDARFQGTHNFTFPPHTVYSRQYVSPGERNLALLCKRLLEMDVPEMMSSFLAQEQNQPWEFRRDYARQLWDEARHAMMGEVAFEAHGIDWTTIPLNAGFSLRLNLHATPEERRLLLYAIEQSLMPAETGKKFEYETALAAGDPLSAHFHDYDWADEVLHAQIGRKWLREDRGSAQDLTKSAQVVHEKTWRALEEYKRLEAQDGTWWKDLVLRVLGEPSAARREDLETEKVDVIPNG
jgi:hypothetical protein